MDSERLYQILSRVKSGEVSVEDALAQLANLPYEELGFAKIDHHRALRTGFPEVVFGPGKTAEQIAAITEGLASASDRVLVTKVAPECFDAVRERLPDAEYHPIARAITINRLRGAPSRPGIMVICGGTSDIPIAEEAAITAELMGNAVERSYDVGVAGVHRLLDHLPRLRQARVVVAVAGMEGALPSVVSGLISVPVIAVPTSVGYGASFGGLAPLLAMLNSCAAGVSVVNIDNGFGAGYLAALINR
ncbi:MAG: nickel pincer cofactor biosynthesis protein LarB [Dehalococcoidia bacterium]|nr:MAG: nickel pincer cofactor biosynthesis protein LarB [Dehalococcoidia bacterium]